MKKLILILLFYTLTFESYGNVDDSYNNSNYFEALSLAKNLNTLFKKFNLEMNQAKLLHLSLELLKLNYLIEDMLEGIREEDLNKKRLEYLYKINEANAKIHHVKKSSITIGRSVEYDCRKQLSYPCSQGCIKAYYLRNLSFLNICTDLLYSQNILSKEQRDLWIKGWMKILKNLIDYKHYLAFHSEFIDSVETFLPNYSKFLKIFKPFGHKDENIMMIKAPDYILNEAHTRLKNNCACNCNRKIDRLESIPKDIWNENEHLANKLAESTYNYSQKLGALLMAKLQEVFLGGSEEMYLEYEKDEDEMIEIIMDGADINFENEEGLTPLILTMRKNRGDLFDTLLDYGANIEHYNKFGRTPLISAVLFNEPFFIQLLVDEGADIEKKHLKLDATPLLFAVLKNMDQAAEKLILLGANVNAKCTNYGKITPLSIAAKKGNAYIGKLLIEHGAKDIEKVRKIVSNYFRETKDEKYRNFLHMLSEINSYHNQGLAKFGQ